MIKLAIINSDVQNVVNNPYKVSCEGPAQYTLNKLPCLDFIDQIDENETLVVFLNIKLRGKQSEALLNQIKYNKTKIFLLLTYDNNNSHVNDSVLTQASKIVINDKHSNSLVEELKHVLNEGIIINPRITKRIVKFISEPKIDVNDKAPGLTNREVELMNLILKGMSNKEVSKELNISCNTVKNHLKKIFLKLNSANRSEAILNYLMVIKQ